MLVTIVTVVIAVVTLVQIMLRWRARGVQSAGELAECMREEFRRPLEASDDEDAVQATDRPPATLEARLATLRGQLHSRTLVHEVDELLVCWRTFVRAPTPGRLGRGSAVCRECIDGLEQVQRVIACCNQLTRWIVSE
jgi:hypothetical protein